MHLTCPHQISPLHAIKFLPLNSHANQLEITACRILETSVRHFGAVREDQHLPGRLSRSVNMIQSNCKFPVLQLNCTATVLKGPNSS